MSDFTSLAEPTGFLASGEWPEAKGVIFGAPLDLSVSYRPGTRFGPPAIREVSSGLETYSLSQGLDLTGIQFCDAGDIEIIPGNLAASLQRVKKGVQKILSASKIPFMLGGEHLATVPALEACLSKFPELILLHFDAHADLRGEYLGEKLSHANVISLAREMGVKEIFSFGIRSAAAEEVSSISSLSGFYPQKVIEPMKRVLASINNKPVYITFDIDVVDPAYAPGTGTPEPGGITSSEALAAAALWGHVNVVGMDIMEVCPPYDPSGITAMLAAKLLREALLSVLGGNKDG